MRSVTKRWLALLLALVMVLPLAACANDPAENEDTTPSMKEEDTGRQPTVSRNDYDKEFVAYYCSDTFRDGYYFIEEDKRKPGNDMDDSVYERMVNTETYLGVDIKAVNGGIFSEYGVELKRLISSNEDAYQMVMTHTYMEVATLITENYLREFGDFESINLEAEYWNSTLMEDMAINDSMYCGYNDFCLAQCYVIGFNKDIVAKYPNDIGNLYDQVRNKQWTLDKFISYASLIGGDSNGDGSMNEQDSYGLSTLAWVPLISFQIASNIKVLEKDEAGDLYLSPMKDNKDKIVNLAEKITNFMAAESTYTWDPFTNKPTLKLNSGRVMFEIMNNFELVTTKEDDVKVGVLPYPLYDTKQKDYQTMNWNGVLVIPSSVKEANMDMTGDVIEMLAFYSEPVTTSFYETLLGSKVADAPEDVEMLRIIWSTQVSDLGLIFSGLSPELDCIMYAIPHHISAGQPSYSTYFQSNQRAVTQALRKLFAEG